MQKLEARQIHFADVTLHVGLDTFQPVSEADPQTHRIHKEWCGRQPIPQKITETRANGHRIVAVGTTSARTLESAAQAALKSGSPDRPFRSAEIPVSIFAGV